MKLYWLRTTRVSQVIGAFLVKYAGATVLINRAPETRPVEVWCTNRILKSARDFSLTHGGVEILAFHDGYTNMWAHESVMPFLDELVSQRLIRYSVEVRKPGSGVLSRIVRWLSGSGEKSA